MVYCAANNCTNGSASGWALHVLPQSKTCLHDWLRNMSRVPTYHIKLCGEQFEERRFVISPSLA